MTSHEPTTALDLGLGTPATVVQGALTDTGAFVPKDGGSLADIPIGSYVYVVSAAGWEIPRAVDPTRVLYIGQSSRQERVGHLSAGHSACSALARLHWAKQPKDGHLDASVSVFESAFPDLDECMALNRFVGRHGELPPANSRWEGWLARLVLERLASEDRGDGARPAWNSERACNEPPPSGDQPCWSTWVHVYTQRVEPGTRGNRSDKDWLGAIGWLWPGWDLPLTRPQAVADLAGSLLVAVNTDALETSAITALANQFEEVPGGRAIIDALWGESGKDCTILRWTQSALGLSGYDSPDELPGAGAVNGLLRRLLGPGSVTDAVSEWLAGGV